VRFIKKQPQKGTNTTRFYDFVDVTNATVLPVPTQRQRRSALREAEHTPLDFKELLRRRHNQYLQREEQTPGSIAFLSRGSPLNDTTMTADNVTTATRNALLPIVSSVPFLMVDPMQSTCDILATAIGRGARRRLRKAQALQRLLPRHDHKWNEICLVSGFANVLIPPIWTRCVPTRNTKIGTFEIVT
jgi:hypothetical protein